MSLLNEALRKKDREVRQAKKINLFRNRPTPLKRGKKWSFVLVIVIVLLIALAGFGTWYGFFAADSPFKPIQRATTRVHIENTLNNKPARPLKPLQIQLEDEPPTPPITASTIERKDQKTDKNTSQTTDTLKDIDTTTTVPTKKRPLTVKTEKKERKKALKAVKTPAPPSQKTEHLFYKKAVSYHRQNKLDMAIRMYLEVLAENPENPDAGLNLSSAYLQSSLFTKARPLLEKLMHDDPENPKILLNFAIMEIGLGRPDKAIRYLEKSERLSEEPHFQIYFHRGVAFSHLEKLDEALTWYKRAEKLSENNPLLLFNMAVVYDKLEKYEKALRYYVSLQGHAENQLSESEKTKIDDRIRVLKMFLARQKN
jgi:Tfp pilus assembly protein PilF